MLSEMCIIYVRLQEAIKLLKPVSRVYQYIVQDSMGMWRTIQGPGRSVSDAISAWATASFSSRSRRASLWLWTEAQRQLM